MFNQSEKSDYVPRHLPQLSLNTTPPRRECCAERASLSDQTEAKRFRLTQGAGDSYRRLFFYFEAV